jgi:hypothetical protein
MKPQFTPMARKQYLIPARAVRKIEALSRSEKVSQGEIVRRAIEAYEPKVDANETEIVAFLDHADTLVRQTIKRLDETHRHMTQEFHAIQSGENRRQAEADMRAWAGQHSEVVARFAELMFGARGEAEPPSAAVASLAPKK